MADRPGVTKASPPTQGDAEVLRTLRTLRMIEERRQTGRVQLFHPVVVQKRSLIRNELLRHVVWSWIQNRPWLMSEYVEVMDQGGYCTRATTTRYLAEMKRAGLILFSSNSIDLRGKEVWATLKLIAHYRETLPVMRRDILQSLQEDMAQFP